VPKKVILKTGRRENKNEQKPLDSFSSPAIIHFVKMPSEKNPNSFRPSWACDYKRGRDKILIFDPHGIVWISFAICSRPGFFRSLLEHLPNP
jgi:hypothetical protein